MGDLVRVDRRERVAVLTLNDPERRNALSAPLVADIAAAVDELERDDHVGALVVTGAPPAFCAGADLSDLARSYGDGDGSAAPDDSGAGESAAGGSASGDSAADEVARDALRGIYEGFLRISRSSLPTVAAVNGAAVGAGLNMAMGCDVRFAAESARFDSRFVALGLHPGGGGTWLLHRALGAQGTAALGLFGERVDGRQAAEIGLVWRCVPDDTVVGAAVEYAKPVSEAPKQLIARLKETLARWPSVATHEEAVDVELEPQIWSVRQPEFQERLTELRHRIASRDR